MRKIAHSEWLFVTAMLLLAAGLRFIGVTFGQPDPQYAPSTYPQQMLHAQSPLQPDEYELVSIPLEMVVKRTINLPYINYGLLTTMDYVTYFVTDAGNGITVESRARVNSREFAPFHLYVIGRIYSALGGVLAAAAAYASARLLFGRFAALAAGSVTAVSLVLVQHGHYVTGSSLSAGLGMVVVWACFVVLYQKRPSWWLFAIAGIATGLAGASRNNAAGVSIVLCLTGLVLLYRLRSWQIFKLVMFGWALFPLFFVLGMPQILLNLKGFWDGLIYGAVQYRDGLDDLVVSPEYGLLVEYRHLLIFGLGAPAAGAIIFGLLAAWGTRPRFADWLKRTTPFLCIAILLAYIAAYSYIVLQIVQPDGSDQMVVPIIPPLALLAGGGAAFIYERLPISKRIAAIALAGLLIVVPLVSSVQFVRQLTQPDTRQLMQSWVYEHLPRGSTIHLVGPYNVPLDRADYLTAQNFGGDFLSLTEIQAQDVDYIILSDAYYYSIQRGTDVYPASYIQQVNDYVASFADVLTPIAVVERPQWTGYDWTGHTPSYWHNPSLTVYCVNACN